MANIKMVASMDEFNAVLAEAGDKAVIIDFYADWCGPCKMIAPRFKELADQCTNVVTMKVDVDDADDVAAFCKVEAMPTFAVFKSGKQVDSLVGASPDKLKDLFTKYN